MQIKIKDLSVYRSSLMGIAILYVFLFHTVTDWAPEWLFKITCNGDNGVDIFIFLSALGLSYSLNKNPDIWSFYKRRLCRIFPTCWFSVSCILGGVILLIQLFHAPTTYMSHPTTIWEWIGCYTTLGFWWDGGVDYNGWYDWYIPSVVAFYLFFPLLYNAMKRTRWTTLLFFAPITLSAIGCIHIPWYYSCFWYRIGVFICGTACFYFMDKEYSRWKAYLVLAVGAICPFVYAYTDILNTGYTLVDRTIFAIVLVCAMLAICQLLSLKWCRWINKPLAFMGGISLEFYLIHQQLYRMIQTVSNKLCEMPDGVKVLLCFIISLIGAIIIQKCVKFLTSLNFHKKITCQRYQ